jgi:DNA repair exonuclease SbcCD ATPase subunit
MACAAQSGAQIHGMLYGLRAMPREPQDEELDMTLTNFLAEMREMDRTRTEGEKSRINTVLREIQAVNRKIDTVRDDLGDKIKIVRRDLGEEIKGVQARVVVLEQKIESPPSARRIPTSDPPTAHELGLKPSKSGQVSFEEVQHAMATKLMELDTEIRESDARAEGAREALAHVKEEAEAAAKAEREKWNLRIKLLAASMPILLALGAILAKLMHL